MATPWKHIFRLVPFSLCKTNYFHQPCYAGCTGSFEESAQNGNWTIYEGCKGSTPPGVTATPGYCESDCPAILGGIVILFFTHLFGWASSVIIPTILVRIVKPKDKPLVLANKLFVGKLLGMTFTQNSTYYICNNFRGNTGSANLRRGDRYVVHPRKVGL